MAEPCPPDGNPVLGYIGLGSMGQPMALRLLAAGYQLHVWGRTQARLSRAVDAGAHRRTNARDLAAGADIVFTCLTDTAAVQDVVFGADGIAQGGRAGSVLIDMSTIAPDATRRMAAELRVACGMVWIDAPVSGGVAGAESGTLAIMAGGDAAALDRVRPVLRHLGRSITRMGDAGAGQTTKLINQTIVACTMAVLAEALGLATKAGLRAEELPKALAGGRADSPMLQQLLPRMLAEDYAPTSTITSLLKDLTLVGALARETHAPMPITGLVTELQRWLVSNGHAAEDITSIFRFYREGQGSTLAPLPRE